MSTLRARTDRTAASTVGLDVAMGLVIGSGGAATVFCLWLLWVTR